MLHCPECRAQYAKGQYCPKDGARLVELLPGNATPLGAAFNPVATRTAGEELVGQVIAERFRVIRSLGEGGMGHVYEVRHLYIDKRVALKLLRPEITASAEAVERFQREAMAASTIGHENIVRIDDFGRLADGRVYLTMEYLEGESLAAALGREPLAFPKVLDIMIQVCRGLAAAHAKGIVHRDMKADNVFLCSPDDRVAILDFGIAKVSTHGPSNLTKTGAVFGTPNYMSPEQAMGQPVDHRCDVYSVGVMLYEMLTGAVPFEAESFMGVLTRHITEQPLPPRERAPGRQIPPELEAIALKAMAKKADERYADMDQLVEELVRVRAQSSGLGTIPLRNGRPPELAATALPLRGPVSVRPDNVTPTAGEIMERPEWPNGLGPPRRRWLLGVVMVLAVGLGGWGVFAWRRATSPPVPSAARPALRPAGRPADATAAGTKAADATPVQPPQQVGAAPARPSRAVAARSRRAAARKRAAAAVAEAATLAAAAADAAAEAAPAEVKLILASVPSGAQILRGGQPVGETPEVLLLEPGAPVTLVLQRAGFRPVEVSLVPHADEKRTIRLRRIRGGRRGSDRRGRGNRVGDAGGDTDTTAGGQQGADDHGHSDHTTPSEGSSSGEDDHGP